MADHEVRFPETYVSGVPVWAKRRKRSSVHPLLNLIVILLALFGAVVIAACRCAWARSRRVAW